MSFNWLLVRGASADPLSLKFAALQNKQSIAENEIFKPERARPKIISRYTEDLVLVQDPFSFHQLKNIANLHYFGPFEPDGVSLKYWCQFNHIAKRIHDSSFTDNWTFPVGNPKLCEGPNDGVKGGTIVTKINSDPNSNTIDYFYTYDDSSLKFSSMGSGFSIFMWIMPEVIGPNGNDMMLRMKMDDTGGVGGYMIKIGADGSLKFIVRRTSVTRNFISAPNKLTQKQYYLICLTYNMSTNAMDMRINNQVQTDSADESPTFPTGHSLNMFHGIGVNQTNERFSGILVDSRTYNDKIFTGAEMDNIWNNKRSISPIEYGHLSVAGSARFNSNAYTGAYDLTAYDSTGYATL